MKVFRSHHAVPDVPMSPTLLGLAKEWVAINDAAEYHRQIQRLEIDGCFTPGDLVDRIDASTIDRKNQILHRLIVADTYLATRIILQAFLPKILKEAQRRRALSGGDLEDHIQEMVSELWERVADYPRESTAARWTKFTTQRLLPGPLVAEVEHLQLEEEHLELAATERDTLAAETIEALFRAGLDRGVVTEDDVELLNELYLGVDEVTSAEVAANRGSTPANVRKRSERIKRRLALLEV